MKTKEFMRRVEDELGYIAHKSTRHILITDKFDNPFADVHLKKTFNIDTDFKEFRCIDENGRKLLFNLILEYARTPLEEREEEKKYRYKFPFLITETNSRPGHICKFDNLHPLLHGSGLNVKIDISDESHVFKSGVFHFTDKEVEKFTGRDRALFNICKKIEVTP